MTEAMEAVFAARTRAVAISDSMVSFAASNQRIHRGRQFFQRRGFFGSGPGLDECPLDLEDQLALGIPDLGQGNRHLDAGNLLRAGQPPAPRKALHERRHRLVLAVASKKDIRAVGEVDFGVRP